MLVIAEDHDEAGLEGGCKGVCVFVWPQNWNLGPAAAAGAEPRLVWHCQKLEVNRKEWVPPPSSSLVLVNPLVARPARQPAGKRKVHLQSSSSTNTKVEYRRLDLNLSKGGLIISTVIPYPFTFNFSVPYVLAVCYAYSGIWIVVTFIQSWSFLTVKFEMFTFIMITYTWR